MVTSNNIIPGMILSIGNKLYRVETCVKVTVPKGTPFIKTKLKNLVTNQTTEKNFKLNQTIQEISLVERTLEYLYPEGKSHLFLDIGNLEQVSVPFQVIGDKIHYLKEGVALTASFYGNIVFSVELPQFLELMVVKVENKKSSASDLSKIALLETGAKIEIPPFIESGDIVKVDTKTNEYIQRV